MLANGSGPGRLFTYPVASSARKSALVFVLQLRGPHLSAGRGGGGDRASQRPAVPRDRLDDAARERCHRAVVPSTSWKRGLTPISVIRTL